MATVDAKFQRRVFNHPATGLLLTLLSPWQFHSAKVTLRLPLLSASVSKVVSSTCESATWLPRSGCRGPGYLHSPSQQDIH